MRPLAQRRLGRGKIGIGSHRFLYQRVERRRAEQHPPIARDVTAAEEALRRAARHRRRRGPGGQRARRIAIGSRRVRSHWKSGPTRTAPQRRANGGQRRRSLAAACFIGRPTRRCGPLVRRKRYNFRSGSSSSTQTRRRENRSISTGNTKRIRNGASRIPPTTTSANGFCTCDPIPVEMAAGSRPTQAATQVIATGRICTSPVRTKAAPRSMPPSISRLK